MAKSLERLREVLRERQPEILQEWLQVLLETYPQDSAHFFKRQKNQFANPVGHIFETSLTNALEHILFSDDTELVKDALDELIRVRAVQDFSPAGALAFVFDLKGIVRAYCLDRIREEGLEEVLWRLDARIDEMALIALNIYSSCREELAEIRINEVKSNVYFLLKRAKMLVEEESPPGGVEYKKS